MTGSIVDRPPRQRLARLAGPVRPAWWTSAHCTEILPISGRIVRTVKVLTKDKTPQARGFRKFAGFPPKPATSTASRANVHSDATCARLHPPGRCRQPRSIGRFCLMP